MVVVGLSALAAAILSIIFFSGIFNILLGFLCLWAGGIVAYVLFAFFVGLPIKMAKPRKISRFYRRLSILTCDLLLCVSRVKLVTEGFENLPKTPCLIVCNHLSNFDPVAMMKMLDFTRVIFVSKPENFKLPLVGKLMRGCGFLSIDREDPRKAIVTIQQAGKILENREASVCIYPEGTRNKSAVGLLPFHSGVFRPARAGNAPIAVMTISGTEKIHKNYPWRSTVVKCKLLQVISAQDAAANKPAVLSEIAERAMLESFEADK